MSLALANTPSFFRHLSFLPSSKSVVSDLPVQITKSVHSSFIQLAVLVGHGHLQGSTARCLVLLRSLHHLLQDVLLRDVPRELELRLRPNLSHLTRMVKSLTVMEKGLLRYVKAFAQSQAFTSHSEDESLGPKLTDFAHQRIELPATNVQKLLMKKIAHGDTLMLYSSSSLVLSCLRHAVEGKEISVILLDSPPKWEGRRYLQQLLELGIPVRYSLLSSAPSLLKDTNKIVIGAHALTANGCVLARVGTAYLANVAASRPQHTPFLVVCPSSKMWERVQADSIVYNEIEPDGSVSFDLTPGDLVSGLVTELEILPCTSSPVVLRVTQENA